MLKIAVVGCTGRLGSAIVKNILHRDDVELTYAIAREGNVYVGKTIAELVGGNCDKEIISDIEQATECDVFIDCTNADTLDRKSVV